MLEALLPSDFRVLVVGPVRRFYGATMLSALGTGLIISLNIIYVHLIRHHSIFFATFLLSMNALLGLALTPVIGTLTDKVGPVKVTLVSVVLMTIGLYCYAYTCSAWAFVVVSAILTIGGSGSWSPLSTMLARLIGPEHRQRAFGFNFMFVNLGIGAGALVSSSVVDRHNPLTFTHLYLGTATLTALTGIIYATLWRHGGPVREALDEAEAAEAEPVPAKGGWGEVLGDRRLRNFVLAALFMLICGYGSLEAGFSLFVVTYTKLTIKSIGIVFFFNTLTIVLAQLFVLGRIQGKSRARVMSLVGVLWALSWVFVTFTLHVPAWFALVLLCAAQIVFAIGETLWSPVAPALVNQIAPEHLRGRYNAAFGFTWTISGFVAPLIAALFLATSLGRFWPMFVGGGALVGSLLATRLRHHLTPLEDGLLPEELTA